jgi:flagellar protein FlgJ
VAISPPSDIVLDVARAVEPAGLEAAKAQLARRTAATGAAGALAFAPDLSGSTLEASRIAHEASSPFVKFEAMVLRSFVETMLPDDAGSVYGAGMSGDMWKGLMAEQLGSVIAERGGIGIADRILSDHYYDGSKRMSLDGVASAGAQVAGENANSLSSALVNELQRKLNSGLAADTAVGRDKR